jgi:hypothetical protein
MKIREGKFNPNYIDKEGVLKDLRILKECCAFKRYKFLYSNKVRHPKSLNYLHKFKGKAKLFSSNFTRVFLNNESSKKLDNMIYD